MPGIAVTELYTRLIMRLAHLGSYDTYDRDLRYATSPAAEGNSGKATDQSPENGKWDCSTNSDAILIDAVYMWLLGILTP